MLSQNRAEDRRARRFLHNIVSQMNSFACFHEELPCGLVRAMQLEKKCFMPNLIDVFNSHISDCVGEFIDDCSNVKAC